MSGSLHVDDVFGTKRAVPINYIEREAVDGKLLASLSRDKHLVIYGSSKQGKTCLRKHCLLESDYTVIQCSNKWAIKDLFLDILKRVGFKQKISESITLSGTNKTSLEFSADAKVFSATIGGDSSETKKTEVVTKSFELNLEDVNDVIEALKGIGFKKFIVLEDFHYLPEETQKDFSIALKAFHENSEFCFIVVGVWLEKDKLAIYNGDLAGRVYSIDADIWSEEDLYKVINTGCGLLNIQISEKFKKDLIMDCKGSVSIVQEVCNNYCKSKNIYIVQKEKIVFDETFDVKKLVNDVVEESGGRYTAFLRNFSGGFHKTDLEMYRWILYAVVTTPLEKLNKGLIYNSVITILRANHPNKTLLNAGNVTQALQKIASLQLEKGIKPFVLDYDQSNNRLNIVDRSFVIWISTKKESELLELIGLSRS
jgi:hypothetical protein